MRIRAPDDAYAQSEATSNKVMLKEVEKTFVDEIKELLQVPEISSKCIAEGVDCNSASYKLEVLKKFTALCREEIIPRHKNVADVIQAKANELQCKMAVQEKELAQITAARQELEESRIRLETTKALVQRKDEELNIRLRETLYILKNQSRNKTLAEQKMAQDLVKFKKKADDLKVSLTGSKAKLNYYTNQVNAQTEMVTKHSKPLYLDKNRAVFLRSNLNSMRENIEQLVSRLKVLNKKVVELQPGNQNNE